MKKTCRCKKDGVCVRCGGLGGVFVPNFFVFILPDIQFQENACQHCKGTGKCPAA